MTRNLDRLRKGERWWAAEFVVRSLGLLLLTTGNRLWLVVHRLVTTPPPHQATLGELAVCLGVAGCLASGLALTLFGPRLFAHVPIPASARRWSEVGRS